MKQIRWFMLVLFAVALLGATAMGAEVVHSGSCGDAGSQVEWALDSDGVLTISGTGNMKSCAEYKLYDPDMTYTAPWYDLRDSIKSVVVEEGVTGIGRYAFARCQNIVSVSLPEGLTSMGDHAFSVCTSLEEIVIPEGITVLKDGTFDSCGALRSVTLPESLTEIAGQAFWWCSSLRSVSIPASVSKIGTWAFRNCGSLVQVGISGDSIQVGDEAFSECPRLANVYCMAPDANNVRLGKKTGLDQVVWSYGEKPGDPSANLGDGACGENVTWTLSHDGILTIQGTGAMQDYSQSGNVAPWDAYKTQVSAIVVEPGVTTVGAYAFYNLFNAGTIALPEGIVSIGEAGIYGCMGLSEIKLPETLKSIGQAGLSHCSGILKLIIPDSVTSIGLYAMTYCQKLEEVTLGRGMTTTGEGMFAYCDNLKTVNMPETLTNIESYTFNECHGLQSITIGSGVKTIGKKAFFNAYNLYSVTLPRSVEHISESAFQYCDKLQVVHYIGEEADRAKIVIEKNNAKLENATWYYEPQAQPPAEPDDPFFGKDSQDPAPEKDKDSTTGKGNKRRNDDPETPWAAIVLGTLALGGATAGAVILSKKKKK